MRLKLSVVELNIPHSLFFDMNGENESTGLVLLFRATKMTVEMNSRNYGTT